MNAIDLIEKKQALIIADDYKISKGVDLAIEDLFDKNKIDQASVFTTTDRFEKVKEFNQSYKLGLHFDLTFGKAISIQGKSLITDENGYFNKNFIQILLFSLFYKRQMFHLIDQELKAQFEALKKKTNKVYHINGHQHIHTIPLIFKLALKLKEEKNIEHLRFINEKIISIHLLSIKNILNLVKLALLRFLNLFNSYKSDIYFVSIFYTCKISKHVLLKYKIPKEYKKIELMLHPGDSNIDTFIQNKEKKHLTSYYRDEERNCL